MPKISDRDKRTLRLGGIAVAAYLVVFGLFQVFKSASARKADYQKLLAEALLLKSEVRPYEDRVRTLQKLMGIYNLDPAKLSSKTVVAEANSAIQKAAQAGGVQLGPIRESVSRSSEKDMASIQLDATGQVQPLMSFLQRLQTLGYPLILDTVQVNSMPGGPGMLKVHVGITILDFDQWTKKEIPHA
ncbi:MAG TPA: hypothetical protein VMF06_03145 [Candidatus Limnocylindria bacterium]|nr:hypothetical protein [Candidatus Limnocylindria bacterium]